MTRLWRWFLSLFRKAPQPLYMGVSVFTGWASPRPEYGKVPGVQCPVEWPWRDMRVKDRVPAIGEYDEADPMVTEWRTTQMILGRVDWVTYQHEWSPHLGKLTMNNCAENHPADSLISFAMSWWDVLTNSMDGAQYFDNRYALDGDNSARWTKDRIAASLVAYSQACEPITRKPSYLKIDGRPVLFRGAANSLRFYGQWGISPMQALDFMASAFGRRPYFVATACDPTDHAVLKKWGFDAFTEYNLYSDTWANVAATYREYWARSIGIAKQTGIDYWVPTSTGFDGRAWGSDTVFIPTPEQFTEHLKEARAFAQANYEQTEGRVITNNWSEYGEGSVLEPMQPGMLHNGDEMLMAHAKAVTQ